MTAGTNFRYRAFLSYSHSDEAAATRLHRALEHYALPARVRKAHGLPRRLIPIFRDVEELAAASGLTTRLQDALDQSQWLIVLCSPAAAQSRYVNQEIEYFLGKHGPQRILCALIAGEPADSFPPAIKGLPEEPLAADFRPGKDFELSKLKLIAALAGVGFTELRNREAQRRKRQQVLAASLLVAMGLAALAWWDLFRREHVDHYVSHVRRHGIWQGVDAISADIASQRAEGYRFIRSGRLRAPRRVDFVNGSGFCPGEGMDGPLGHPRRRGFDTARGSYCSVRFEYDEAGTLAREAWLNRAGRVVDSLTYTEDGLAQFTQKGFVSAEGSGGVFYVHAERDEHGFDRRVQFLHSLGNPRANQRHEFGLLLDYDPDGRVIRRSVLDDRGSEVGPVTRYRHDDRGQRIETRHTDLDGAPQIVEGHYSSKLSEYNAEGNLWRDRFFLPDGTAAVAAGERLGSQYVNSGFSAVTYAWDRRGNNIELRLLDAEGHPVNGQLGFAVERMSYDERGNIVRHEFLDAVLKPVALAEGVAVVVQKFDDHNNLVEQRGFDPDGNPAAWSFGPSILRQAWDEEARTLKECYFDAEDRPLIVRYGTCLRWTLDQRGNAIALEFLGADDKPYVALDRGAARHEMRRDDRGNIVVSATYDASGKPTVNQRTGFARAESTFDDYGNRVESRGYDAQNRLTRGHEGFAAWKARHDRSGNMTEQTFFDELQRPTRHKDGYFGYRAQFDSRGRMTRKEFLDSRGGLLKLSPFNAYGLRYGYDSLGSVTREIYLDARGADATRIERRRDEFGREIEARYLDAVGKLMPHPVTGCATQRFDYDRYSQLVGERCLDAAGQPVNRRDFGWAVKKINPTISGVKDESYFDTSGRPVKPKV